jgi:hypothetical protein
MRSFYLMHRGWMDTPALGGRRDAFCRRAAWAWLIEEACWADRRVSIKGSTVTLQRGQVGHSLRFMAAAWKWSRSAVERFIERLKTETMIETATDMGQFIITICNYDSYQTLSSQTGTATETVTEAGSRQDRDRTETNDNEGNEVNKGMKSQGATHPSSAEPTTASSGADILPGAMVIRLPDPLQEAAAAWNAMAAMCGLTQVKVRSLNGTRRESLRLRLKECGGLDGWRKAIGQIPGIDWMIGKGERGWKADFDFVLQRKSFTKLIEGAYANRGRRAVRAGDASWMSDPEAHLGLPDPAPAYDLDLQAEAVS